MTEVLARQGSRKLCATPVLHKISSRSKLFLLRPIFTPLSGSQCVKVFELEKTWRVFGEIGIGFIGGRHTQDIIIRFVKVREIVWLMGFRSWYNGDAIDQRR